MFLFQYATIVKAAIDSGTCASISSETTCDTSAISYYETFEYNGNRVIISSGSPSHDAENGEMSELDKSINKQVMLNRFLQSSRILVHLSRRFYEFITWTA